MTDDQLKLADYLLMYLVEKRGYSSLDDYPSYLQNKMHFGIEIEIVKKKLLEIKLVRENETGYLLYLTDEGEKAANIGLKQHFRNIEERERLEQENLKIDLKMKTIQWKSYWYLVALTILSVLTSLYLAFK